MSIITALRLAIANIASDYWHAARDGVLTSNLTGIPAFRIAQFWGTYQGFRRKGAAPAALRERFYYPHGMRRPRRPATNAGGRPIDYDNPNLD
jgi:hypothetical protein